MEAKHDTVLKGDLAIRTTLSEVLGSYVNESVGYSVSRGERMVKVLDWTGIAFHIGKLKAQAERTKDDEIIQNQTIEISNLRTKIQNLERDAEEWE